MRDRIYRAFRPSYFSTPPIESTKERPAKPSSHRNQEIIALFATGKYTRAQLGEKFGVTSQRIGQILKSAEDADS
jgi:hypothetical protein